MWHNDYFLAAVLGVIEGLTEFLPISSTAHLLLFQHLTGVSLEEQGFWKLFDVVIQLGAVLAAAVFFRKTILDLIQNFLKPPFSIKKWLSHPLFYIGLAVVPAGFLGLILKKHIYMLMGSTQGIGIALIVGAVVMEFADQRWGQHNKKNVPDSSLYKMTLGQSMGIGISQAFALIPGVSRSGASIVGGLAAGLNFKAAAEFSFLLSIPTMAAASILSLIKHETHLETQQLLTLLIGFGVSFVVGWAVIAWFLSYLKTKGFRAFVIYRIGLGIFVLWIMK